MFITFQLNPDWHILKIGQWQVDDNDEYHENHRVSPVIEYHRWSRAHLWDCPAKFLLTKNERFDIPSDCFAKFLWSKIYVLMILQTVRANFLIFLHLCGGILRLFGQNFCNPEKTRVFTLYWVRRGLLLQRASIYTN